MDSPRGCKEVIPDLATKATVTKLCVSEYLPAHLVDILVFQSISSLWIHGALGFPLLESLLICNGLFTCLSFPWLLGIIVFACSCVTRVRTEGVC